MAAEIIQIDAQSFLSQTYENQDTNLISSFDVKTNLSSSSYLEFFVYDNNKNILDSDYNFTQYTIQNDGQSPGNDGDISEIIIDPEQTLINLGYDQGEYTAYFNIFNKQIGTNFQNLYIAEISSDRTEIRLDSTSLTEIDLIEQSNNLIQQRVSSSYFLDFYLNFGDNQLAIANNIELDIQDPTNPTILIKLYEPLSDQYDLNSLLWVVTVIEEPIAYQVIFEDVPIVIIDTVPINGPNFNLELKDKINNSTLNQSYQDLTATTLTSSFNQLNSLLEEKEIDINIDYTNFAEFTHFSSVKTRLENFYYKVSLIEQYSSSIATLNNTNSSSVAIGNTQTIYETQINNIITNFDGYDYYLYYSSGSYAWPKTTSQPPYLLAKTGSNAVLTWFGSDDETNPNYGGIILSASRFDESNKDYLFYVIPEYLREDPNNDQYKMFIDMVGQFYDNIWIYYKDVTQKYNADNRLENGISKDIVADAIRDFGLKLYQNNFSNEDLYTAFLGLTPDGALFPFPNITGSLPTPSGFEYIDTLISASNDYMPLDDVNKSLYKRIYHNLPYLLKSKGTLPALRTLITSYGIPDTILRINEYGGKDKANTNDWDYWQNEFNYTFYTTGSNHISSSWPVNTNWNSLDNVPRTVEFRFKTEGLPTSNIPYSQSLWNLDGVGPSIILKYTGSGYTTNPPTPNNPLGLPYSGSIIDPYYQYATLEFCSDPAVSPAGSASIYFPFFDGGWWSVMVTRENTQDFTLHAGNKIYEGGDNGTLLGFYTSSYILSDDVEWANSNTSFFAKSQSIAGNTYNSFSGSIQEIRYYNKVISPDVFKDYIMNPSSIEGDSINSSPEELMFRASLGGELYTGSLSIHPKVTGSWVATSSFVSDSNFNFFTTPTFVPNTEYFFYDQPAVGIKNAVSDKIRLENNVMPSGDTLSPFRSLAQQLAISQSYTANTNLLEVAFSPQDEINEDIMDQIGYFNIGEYIGDPRLRSSSAESYPLLDTLRNDYFEKYTKNYDLVDYIRLIKFFDNSLFKMIKDFVPARTSLASGIVIKQHLLERNKYPQPQVNNNSNIANVGVDNLSSTLFIPGNDTVSVSISYPLTASGIYALSITGSITEDATDSVYYIELYDSNAVLLATLDSFISSPFGTFSFSGSYSGNVPSGSYIYFSADPFANTFQINNFTASLQLINSYYAPYTTQDISVSGTIVPQWNDYNPGTIEDFNGGTGGTFEPFNYVGNTSQSWYETIPTISGSVIVLHDSQDEFYDGEFSGSNIIVTTQSLAQAYPLQNESFLYKQVYYYGTGSGEENIFENLFLNNVTSPQNGEILFMEKGNILFGSWSSIYSPKYLKIAKIDCSGSNNTTALGQLDTILINTPIVGYPTNVWLQYDVTVLNEQSNYYLYQVNSAKYLNQPITYISSSYPNQVFDYTVSSSVTSSYSVGNGSPKTVINWNSSLPGTNLPHYGTSYFNTSSGILTFENTPNTQLIISASIDTSGNDPTSRFIRLIQNRNGVETTIFQDTYNAGGIDTTLVTASLYPIQGDQYYIQLTKTPTGVNVNVTSAQLLLTQSRAVSSSNCELVIFEPYITTPNYYNSDYNPLINNVLDDRLSTVYQDVDYSTGIFTPTNFGLLISGSAIKAAVQDSNYTTKRHIIPRYEGSKSTSQYLNVWTEGDSGTYGKVPTVESLKTMVAYCDSISGWPPERMNASAIHVLYLIKQDGTVVIPNASQNSLADIQGTFMSGEKLIIAQKTVSSGESTQKRNIIRGGTRIEPILYTQYGSAPNATWNTTMSFEDIVPSNTGATADFSALYKRNTSINLVQGVETLAAVNTVVYGAPISTGNSYEVTPQVVLDALELTFKSSNNITFTNNPGNITGNFITKIYKNSISPSNLIGTPSTTQFQNNPNFPSGLVYFANKTVTIPVSNLNVGDKYFATVTLVCNIPTGTSPSVSFTSDFKVTQYPIFSPPVSSSGANSIWNWPNSSSYPYVITSSQTTLVNLYGNPNAKMVDITGSGFNSIVLPWSIKYGDEFRFEGREDFVYQVGKIFGPAESGSGRIFQTGSIEVHLNSNLPISASSSVFNLDHFVIRRYVDDASLILMEGFKPVNANGPYIVRPEYVVPELNKSIDQFILDLTQKGLIT